MRDKEISRRAVLKNLTLGVGATSVLRVIPLEAAEHVHRMIAQERTAQPGVPYKPKFFDAHQWQLLRKLCDLIIPRDEKSGGALDAQAPEFIDLLTSENPKFQTELSGGLLWLDAQSKKRFGKDFLTCTPDEQKQMLDLIAYRKNADQDPTLSHGIEFFALLRNLTADGFYTSRIGIDDIGYVGNTYLAEFPGCPEVPE